MSPVREENEFCIVMLHLPLLISYSRAVDGWYLPWSCGDFQYPEVQNSGREPSSQNDNVYSKKKKGRIAALKIEMYLWWESTLPVQLSEKELLRQLILRNCACWQATIFQKTLVSDYEEMEGQKGTGNFSSHLGYTCSSLREETHFWKVNCKLEFLQPQSCFFQYLPWKNGSTGYFKL